MLRFPLLFYICTNEGKYRGEGRENIRDHGLSAKSLSVKPSARKTWNETIHEVDQVNTVNLTSEAAPHLLSAVLRGEGVQAPKNALHG